MTPQNNIAHRRATISVIPHEERSPERDEPHELLPLAEKILPQTIYDDVVIEGVEPQRFRARFTGKGRRKIGWMESAQAIAMVSWLNVFIVVIPIAWASHYAGWSHIAQFILCFIAVIPLERLLEFGGEQMAFYCGRQLGDLIAITLNNMVEANLAIFLLIRCELKLLQSTIVGVVLLHLLLVPGTSFLTGGVHIMEQNLNPQIAQISQTLLTVGVLTLLLPAAFFAALNPGVMGSGYEGGIISDTTRGQFLQISRGLSVILLLVYVCSRIYLQHPPRNEKGIRYRIDVHGPAEFKSEEERLAYEDPEVNVWACLILLVVTVALTAATAEYLVDSVEPLREQGNIQETFFGLIMLPFVSFAADGVIAICFFIRSALHTFLGTPTPPATLARARAIDLSIQFLLFWMPFFVLLGWWTRKPMVLLFDYFDVALLLGAAFLVNYVTADAKTNWVEGFVLIAFYVMIALCSWFYAGQPDITEMTNCASVQSALAGAVE